MKHIFLSLFFSCFYFSLWGQCPATPQNITGNFVPTNGQILAGTYNVSGIFHVPLGVTVFVEDYDVNGCGQLIVYADSMRIEGTISALGAGYAGGIGGAKGFCQDSVRFQDCSLAAQCMGIDPVTGGAAGLDGNGPGFGNGGTNGAIGRGRKNTCNTQSDRVGRVGGSGGAGGGAGASYGGAGTNSGSGTAGTLPVASANSPNNFCAPANAVPIVAGNGGTTGLITSGYGTVSGPDLDLGSGGGGAGGGGRGHFAGQNGGDGGDGGGLVKLICTKGFYLSGAILCEGEAGGKGGDGGNSGESPRCCMDACPQVNEHTYVGAGGAGSGGGGGSGGGIQLEANGNFYLTGTLSVKGGAGGVAGNGGASGFWSYQEPAFICGTATGLNTTMTTPAALNALAGGHGGGGRIKIYYDSCAFHTFTPNNQVNGGGFGAAAGTIHIQKMTTFAVGTITTLPNPQSWCPTNPPIQIQATAAAQNWTPTYQWQQQINCSGPWSNLANSDSNIVSITPSSGTSACYQVIASSGNCSATYPNTFQINVLPQPFNAHFSSTNFGTCVGLNATLAFTNPIPANSTIQWYNNGVIVPAPIGTTYPLTTNQAGTYSAVISTPGQCTVYSDSTTLTVNPNPTGNITGSSSLCMGNTLTLNAPTGFFYQWEYNGSSIGGNQSSLPITQGGNYIVTMTNLSTGCNFTTPVFTVNANPSPTAGVNVNGATTFCQGGSVQLTGTGGGAYQWMTNNTPNGIATSSFTASASGTYNVIVTNAFNCKDTSATIVVNVNTNPTATISSASNSFCQGSGVWLIGSGANTYSWLGQGINNDSLFVTAGGNYCLQVTQTNTGCIDTACITLTQNPTPIAGINTSGPTTFCQGQSVQLTATGTGTYQWLQNGNNFAGGNPLTVNSLSNYSVVVTTAVGCKDTSNIVTIVVNANPLGQLSAPNTLFCTGDTALFIASGGTSYQWISGSNSNNDSLFITNSGNYCVEIANAAGCKDTLCQPVTVMPYPVATISAPNGTTTCQGNTILLQAGGGTTYQWLLNGNAIAGATASTYLATQSGTYSVVAEPFTLCKDTSIQITLSFQSNLTASLNFTPPATICQGETFTLTASGGNSYEWIVPIGANPSNSNTYIAQVAGDYQVIASDVNGVCIDTSDVVTLTVNPLPNPLINGPSNVCQGQSIVLQTGIYASYQWERNGVSLMGQTNNSLQVTQSGNYTVIVTQNGCSGTSTIKNVTLLPSPIVSILGSDTICPLTSTQLVCNPANFTQYQWVLNGNNIGTNLSTLQAQTIGNYAVIVVNNNGCSGQSAPFVLSNHPSPNVILTPADTSLICVGNGSITFTASGADDYEWFRNGNAILGVSGNSFTTSNNGNYHVIGTDNNGCKDTSTMSYVAFFTFIPPVLQANHPEICNGTPIQLTAINGNNIIKWKRYFATLPNSAGLTSLTVNEPGIYSIVYDTPCGLDSSAIPLEITSANIQASFTFEPDYIFEGTPVQMLDQSQPSPMQWLWSFGDGTYASTQHPVHLFPSVDSFYTQLIAIIGQNCTDTAAQWIHVEYGNSLFIPSAFSPNNDGFNDVFYAKGNNIENFQMQIFDRWGKEIIVLSNITDTWDGKHKGISVPEGAYYYKCTVLFSNNKLQEKSGTVTLVR